MARHYTLISVFALTCLFCAAFAFGPWQQTAYGQGEYRQALINFGLPGLNEERVLALEAAGIPQEGLQQTSLRIAHTSAEGQATSSEFTVELATNPREFQIGLMLRPYMDLDRGMLFLFDVEAEQSFWMRNTLIPLDIIYIASDGSIVSIANGKPLDETSLPSNGLAQYVLELNAGTAKKLGFGPGDVVEWD